MNKINATEFSNKWEGHEKKDLEKILTIKKDRNFIFLAGDSSLDNKAWIKNLSNKGDPLNGYEEIINGKMTKDVAYQINKQLIDNNLGDKYVCINTSIEATTLKPRTENLIAPSDEFIKDHITKDDILIISVGGNDVAFYMASELNTLFAEPTENINTNSPIYKNILKLFKDDLMIYIEKLCNKNKPKYIILNAIYYVCEEYVENPSGWPNDNILNPIGFHGTNKDIIRKKLQELTRLIYINAISKINISNIIIIPVPLFEILDPKSMKDEKCTDYDHLVEPTIEGGNKMAKKFVNLINLYDKKITNDTELNNFIKDLSKESNQLNNNTKLDISIHN